MAAGVATYELARFGLNGPTTRFWERAAALTCAATLLLALAVPASPWIEPNVASGSASQTAVNIDVRGQVPTSVRPTPAQTAALSAIPGATARWDERNGTVAMLINRGGYLSAPGATARSFLRSQAAVLGLSAADLRNLAITQQWTGATGARHVAFQQFDGERLVHGSVIKITLDASGRVVVLGGTYFPGATADETADLSAADAIAVAATGLGLGDAEPRVIARDAGASRRTTFQDPAREDAWTAELVTFPLRRDRAALAWRTMIHGPGGWYETVVDAASGGILYRSDHRADTGPEGTVFTVQSPDVGTRVLVDFKGAAFNAAGWVTAEKTQGNNANAYVDANDDDSPDYQPATPTPPHPGYQHFTFPFTNAYVTSGRTDVTTDRDATVTQAFYRVNWLHDYFYALGFTEAAGNFQDDNFGRGGTGGDAMNVEVHHGFGTGATVNSNTQTPPGQRPTLETIAGLVDHALDADLVTHEYTHGVSNRLVMTEAVGGGLPEGTQTWALGEGWSDFFGTSIYDDPIAGEYVCGNPTTGCPLYRYDNSPLVYSDLCTLGGCEPHRDGEIWTAALWDLRAALGRAATEQLVIDGMIATTPNLPTFLDGRDGLLAADLSTNGGANQCLIWRVFAGREMGLSAATSANQKSVTPASDVPAGCVPNADAGGPYATSEGVVTTLDGTSSSPGTHASTGSLSYAWDLDNDGEYDDAVSATPTFAHVGQDGVASVGLRVTNAAGVVDTDAATISIANGAPVVDLDLVATVAEGGTVTVSGSGSDPGWLDVLTATIDWDDGSGFQALAGTAEQAPPDATLAFSPTHTYGDNGAFSVTVCVSDDDTTACGTVKAQVTNTSPTVAIGATGQSTYAGVSAYVAHAGDAIAVDVVATDPGSDDLTLTWDWDSGPDAVVVSLVNPPAADPLKSPSVQPRSVAASQSHTYGSACAYDLEVRVVDDDAGSGTDAGLVLIVGNATLMRGSGWWMTEYQPGPPDALGASTLECYLEITAELSTVFGPMSRLQAAQILSVKENRGTAWQLMEKQLLAAWLNFANGVIGLDDLVDTDGDGVSDTAFGAVLLTAETVRLNPAATRAQLLAQKVILERIVLRDG